jgi:hypothetical protein
MKKIVSLFQRNYEGDRQVRDEIVPGAEWVAAGEGVATRKYDGTCCLIRNGKLYKRYEVQKGKQPPANFEPANDVDTNTGKQQGWLPVGDGPEDVYHREAFAGRSLAEGSYELLGPKIQGNPEAAAKHTLVAHAQADQLLDCPRTFAELREYLRTRDIEGIVWHHPDGRMVKIKARDFGIKRAGRVATRPEGAKQ